MSEVSNKRFVHFDGTKQEFIDGGYPDQYQESIVFINEDGNESNNTIYTHGEYYGQGVIVEGDASNSAVLKNGNNKALSEYDVAIGMNTISGLRGWYYKAMSISNTGYVYLYLSSNQQLPSFVTSANEVEQENDIVCNLKEGDICCIINGNRFINVFKVKYNHIKQYGRIGFSYIGEGDNPINGIITTEEINNGNLSLDDYCIYCLDRPDIGNVNISEAALTEGNLTKSLNSYTHAEGLRSVAYGKTSHVEGQDNIASGECSHAEGAFTKSKGDASHTEGFNTEASQLSAHAEGYGTLASNGASHAEGSATKATGLHSHAEGDTTLASGSQSHAEGKITFATGEHSHAEGHWTKAQGKSSHAEGQGLSESSPNLAYGDYSHVEGYSTTAEGIGAHAEGIYTTAIGKSSHTEGNETKAIGDNSHAEGHWTKAQGKSSHAEGQGLSESSPNLAYGDYSHVEGYSTTAEGIGAHAEGIYTTAIGNRSHAEGNETKAIGSASHSEGYLSSAYGSNSYAGGCRTLSFAECSHAEGKGTITGKYSLDSSGNYIFDEKNGSYAHAEGENTVAEGKRSHAEGNTTQAIGESSHTEGYNTIAEGASSHAEGKHSQALKEASHAEGYYSIANGKYSHASGLYTNTKNEAEFACGKYNKSTSGTLFSVGCGESIDNRKNIIEVRDTDIILYYNDEDGFVKLSDLLKKKLITVYDNVGNIKIDPYSINNINSLGRMLIDEKFTEKNIFVLSFSFSYDYAYGEYSDYNTGNIAGTIYVPIEYDKTGTITSLQYNCIGYYDDGNADLQTDTISIDINAYYFENQLYIESVYSNKIGVLMNPITNFELSSYNDIPMLSYGFTRIYENSDKVFEDDGVEFKNVYRLNNEPSEVQNVYVFGADDYSVKRLKNSHGADLLYFEKFTGERCEVLVVEEIKPNLEQKMYGAEGVIVYFNNGISIFCPFGERYIKDRSEIIDFVSFKYVNNVQLASVTLNSGIYEVWDGITSIDKMELWFDEEWPLFVNNVKKIFVPSLTYEPTYVTVKYVDMADERLYRGSLEDGAMQSSYGDYIFVHLSSNSNLYIATNTRIDILNWCITGFGK